MSVEKLRKALTKMNNDEVKDILITMFELIENISNEIQHIWEYIGED